MSVQVFIAELQRLYATGQTTEHSFRPALAQLFDTIDLDVTCINEPQAITNVGRPDFVLTRQVGKGTTITVGHCEAKDIGLDIKPKAMRDANKAQHERYVKALPNLIYTNGLEFAFYKEGNLIREIKIGELQIEIQPLPENFEALANQLKDFCAERLQTVTSAEQLAELMAGKAVLIKDVLFRALLEDKELQTDLAGQFKAFKSQLLHDLDIDEFADIYAETVAYGLFAARLHDPTKEDFSRAEALELLPKSNPFLRSLFTFVATGSLHEAIRRSIDELVEIFLHCNVRQLFAQFGSFTQRNDPFIHFYETFLAKYNSDKRKARGVWYTPEPVVNFIVRAVDDVLKSEFGLKQGLADTSKVAIDWDTGNTEFRKRTRKGKKVTVSEPVIEKREVHRVQILDPAAGTGTFLAEVIKQIGPSVQDVAPGAWQTYVEKDLIPRLHGFELLMASYAMCHMKLDMMLSDMDYKASNDAPRFSVYLTNSLEEGAREPQDLFMARWLSEEANLANDVKRNSPIMCVIGNPPYSGESANKGDGFKWIMDLMEAYKKEPGGQEKLNERNPKWINDDYVKFIRFAEYMIAKNGEGVLAFITNHGYLDNPTFRGMRWHLLNSFDKIWVIDLHGSSQKKEVPPEAPGDANVFDIKPGVAIIIAVKRNKDRNRTLASVFRADVFGARSEKNQFLQCTDISQSNFDRVRIEGPRYFFRHWDYDNEPRYNEGFKLDDLMAKNSNGIVTGDDRTLVARNVSSLKEQVMRKYKSWDSAHVEPVSYRLFESTVLYGKEDLVERNRSDIMRHYKRGKNIGLLVSKQVRDYDFAHVFVTQLQSEAIVLSGTTATNAMNIPLYLYPDEACLVQERRDNLDPTIRARIEEIAMRDGRKKPSAKAIFDFIYGVLHCPAYRETYREFLKVDFPRIPYPPSPGVFQDVSAKGSHLRRLHLMEDAAIGDTPYPLVGDGDSVIETAKYSNGAIFINKTQRFENVSEIAWNFFIGGYQPAQKWLKDRKSTTLSFDEILHYQKIIKILTETDRIMRTIELPL